MTKFKETATTEVARQKREANHSPVRRAKARPSRTKRVSMTAKLKQKMKEESMFQFKVGDVVKAPYVIT